MAKSLTRKATAVPGIYLILGNPLLVFGVVFAMMQLSHLVAYSKHADALQRPLYIHLHSFLEAPCLYQDTDQVVLVAIRYVSFFLVFAQDVHHYHIPAVRGLPVLCFLGEYEQYTPSHYSY